MSSVVIRDVQSRPFQKSRRVFRKEAQKMMQWMFLQWQKDSSLQGKQGGFKNQDLQMLYDALMVVAREEPWPTI